jgi:transposase
MSAKRRVFPETFKREAVERVATSGLSAGRVAAELGLHETVLRRWVMQLGKVTAAARRPITQAPPPSPSDLAAENARLRRENDRLRMERDILKKAALIFGSASR